MFVPLRQRFRGPNFPRGRLGRVPKKQPSIEDFPFLLKEKRLFRFAKALGTLTFREAELGGFGGVPSKNTHC